MIETLVYIRYALLWLIPVAIAMTIYFGLRKIMYDKDKNKIIISFIAIFVLAIFILFYNSFLAFVILNDIKQNVIEANTNNSEITVNNNQTNLQIGDIYVIMNNLNFFTMRNHTHNLEQYKITIKTDNNNYSFSFYRDSGNNSLFWLYTDEYNYELELTNVNTNIFENQNAGHNNR